MKNTTVLEYAKCIKSPTGLLGGKSGDKTLFRGYNVYEIMENRLKFKDKQAYR